MPGGTDTQSIRYGYVTDVITHTMVANEADDIAAQLDAADVDAAPALKRPCAFVQLSALSVPVNVLTAVPFSAEIQDTHNMVDLVGQPQRLTASATAGAGLFVVQARWQSDTTGWTRGDIQLNRNGAFYCRKSWYAPQGFGYMQLTARVPLAAVNDYVSFQVFHEGGGTTNTIEFFARIFKTSNN